MTQQTTCSSNKICFSKFGAQTALNALLREGRWNKKEREAARYYHCPLCNAWHITHQSRGSGGQNAKSFKLQHENRWLNLLNNNQNNSNTNEKTNDAASGSSN